MQSMTRHRQPMTRHSSSVVTPSIGSRGRRVSRRIAQLFAEEFVVASAELLTAAWAPSFPYLLRALSRSWLPRAVPCGCSRDHGERPHSSLSRRGYARFEQREAGLRRWIASQTSDAFPDPHCQLPISCLCGDRAGLRTVCQRSTAVMISQTRKTMRAIRVTVIILMLPASHFFQCCSHKQINNHSRLRNRPYRIRKLRVISVCL
jgi:hypothetical protein